MKKFFTADVLIIGGGAAGLFAAIKISELNPQIKILVVEKADIRRSGCLAAGVNALNAYIGKNHTPEDYVNYAITDAHGIASRNLLQTMAERLNQVTAEVERLGLVIEKDSEGNYVERGWRNVKINGENIKSILAQAAQSYPNVEILNHVNIANFLVEGDMVVGAYGFSTRKKILYGFTAKVTLIATGGAAGIYQPNHAGGSRHQIWYPPFNTGAGYAMGIRAGAEMTTFEMRFVALRCKDTIAPTGTLAQGVGAAQINSRGEFYQKSYGNTTSERVFAVTSENLAGRAPCYLKTVGISAEQEKFLYEAYLNMSPAQTLRWIETNQSPRNFNVEICGTEPYIVGGHTAAGYWVDAFRQTTLKNLYAAGDLAGGGIVLSAQTAELEGTIFRNGELSFRAELFDEFYYDVERREFTQVAETENKLYEVGDKIPTNGFSFNYPADLDIILLNAAGFVKIRGSKVDSIGRLGDYVFEKIPLVNGRGFGLKVNSAESFAEFLRKFNAIENVRELADFSNRYFFLNQFRELKFYFDYVI